MISYEKLMKIETHAHTKTCSPCGRVEPENVIEEYINARYGAIIITDHYSRNLLARYEGTYKDKIDSIILGCTHFSVLEEDVKNVLGQDIKIIDSCKAFKEVLKQYLDENDLNNSDNKNRVVKINFTKEDKINTKWFKYPFEGINFINID